MSSPHPECLCDIIQEGMHRFSCSQKSNLPMYLWVLRSKHNFIDFLTITITLLNRCPAHDLARVVCSINRAFVCWSVADQRCQPDSLGREQPKVAVMNSHHLHSRWKRKRVCTWISTCVYPSIFLVIEWCNCVCADPSYGHYYNHFIISSQLICRQRTYHYVLNLNLLLL